MKFEQVSGYLKEIEDADWVQELIMERFDNALEFMTPHSIIYGGAVRDCLAKKELIGDLDFAVSVSDFGRISEAFQTNPKWIPTKSRDTTSREILERVAKEQPVFQIKSSGDLANLLSPMSAVSSFVTMGGKEVQLITSKYHDRDALQSTIYVARMVDIICCGVIMLNDGRIFEVIPGAYQDCLDGVLRINNSSDTIYLDALEFRVQKLVDRGWKNLINVNKVKKEVEESRAKDKRRAKRLAELRQRKSGLSSIPGIKEYNFSHNKRNPGQVPTGYTQEISRTDIDSIFDGDVLKCIKTLDLFANKEGINIRVKHAPIGSIFFETINAETSHKIMRRLQAYNESKGLKKASSFVRIKRDAPIIEQPISMTLDTGSFVGSNGTSSTATYTSPTISYYTTYPTSSGAS